MGRCKLMGGVISRFRISKLYGKYDIDIPFRNVGNILVGENGSGKTTILNALYYTLSGEFYNLSSLDFESLAVSFGRRRVTVHKRDVMSPDFVHVVSGQRQLQRQFVDLKLSESSLNLLAPLREADRYQLFYPNTGRATGRADIVELLPQNENLAHAYSRIKDIVSAKILYLPTYRRIEEDLEKLKMEDMVSTENTRLIQFGMGDVEERFRQMTAVIKNSAIESFSRVNGEMLKQLVDGLQVNQAMVDSLKRPEALKVVLDRVGANLSQNYKENIDRLIRSGEIFTKHDPLIYFLSNLVLIYDQQRDMDNKIKGFATVCNNYLREKQVVYNESLVEISIIDKRSGTALPLSALSSGEKQIVSLFSRIYLETEKNLVVLFDEPELSLSIEWQRRLLPDILASGKIAFLLAVTHSPFIFENSLDEHASMLEDHIKVLDT